MHTYPLNNGLNIPAVGFGTWQILPNARAKEAVLEALRVGYRLLDTARIYGNEEGVGAALRESAVPREEIFVTTKLWPGDHGYDSALRAFDASLERLGLDYIDLYLIHWPGGEERRESWRALEEMYKSGRAKSIGVSNYDAGHIGEILDDGGAVPAVNQIEFHVFNYQEQLPILEFCRQQGIVIEAYSPLAQATQMDNPLINEIAKRYQKTAAQIMMRWCLQHKTVPIPKSSRAERMRENFDVLDFELSAEDMQRLNSLSG